MSRQILHGADARKKLLRGAEQVAETVVSTLGPLGRNVVIQRKFFSVPLVTKDGVTTAKEIDTLPDPFENMGAQLVKDAASKTNDVAGDGTTTATLLAYEMMKAGMKHLESDANAIHIRRGMFIARDVVIDELSKLKRTIAGRADYEAIATISSQDAEIGKMVAEVLEEVGKDGIVTVEAGRTMDLEKEVVEGMQFDNGYISPHFVNVAEGMQAELEDAYILITDEKIHSSEQILPIIEKVGATGKKELVIIADAIEGEALKALILNKIRGNFFGLAIRGPAFGERRRDYLKDIAVLTGGVMITRELGLTLEKASLEDLGRADRVVATKEDTIIVGGKGSAEDVEKRVQEIRQTIAVTNHEFDQEKMQERIAKLSSGVAVIRVGAATEVEQKEKQHRVEDALAATRAAAEEGIVAGGGVAYLRARKAIKKLELLSKDEQLGADIVYDALAKPLYCIADNAGENGAVVVKRVDVFFNHNGYNAESGKYVDMFEAHIIDPKKVTRSALENAVSIAATFLTLEAAVVDIPEDAIDERKKNPKIG